jgi:E3 ubiquitin-protein ligase MARCH6
MDMDINIALDELLGVRGPLSAVIRNLMWLLAFNTVYIGFFVSGPKLLGVGFVSMFSNKTDIGMNSTDSFAFPTNSAVLDVLNAIEAVSLRENTIFRLSDLISVTLGNLLCAAIILFFRCLWILSKKVHFFQAARTRTGIPDDEARDALDEINRIMLGGNANEFNQLGEDQGLAVFYAIGVALDVTTAVVKVGILLFLKMFLLPAFLGLCLDASTLMLFGSSLEDRIAYAGRDLFSFCLLHWVAGITFMLLVTVSVLQLREVAHPELLANMIKPQENSPDLIGNLYHETAATHGRRMALSLIIYSVLLVLHVYVPLRLLMKCPYAE